MFTSSIREIWKGIRGILFPPKPSSKIIEYFINKIDVIGNCNLHFFFKEISIYRELFTFLFKENTKSISFENKEKIMCVKIESVQENTLSLTRNSNNEVYYLIYRKDVGFSSGIIETSQQLQNILLSWRTINYIQSDTVKLFYDYLLSVNDRS